MMSKEITSVRLDKWLWAVRLYKTRRLASDACASNKVKINEKTAKASSKVHTGDILDVQIKIIKKRVKVVGLLEKRVAAPKVVEFLVDLTPAEEYENLKAIQTSAFYRPRGTGRPTKKERRLLEDAKYNSEL